MRAAIIALIIAGLAVFYYKPQEAVVACEPPELNADAMVVNASHEQPVPIIACHEVSPYKQMDPVAVFCSHLQVGANYTRVKLTPHDNPSFSGNLGGLEALYEFRAPERIYGGVKLSWRQGNTKGSAGSRFLLDGDAEERIGYTFSDALQKNLFSLFTGFGFRYLEETHKPLTGSSVNFKYEEYYVPVGFLFDRKCSQRCDFGIHFTWMPQVYPTVKITPLKGARWILTNTYKNFLLEAPVTVTLTKNRRVTFIVKPFFQYWQDGHSTATTETGLALDLPGNTYLFGGIYLNLGYAF